MDPEIMHFLPLIVFGNIENLILAAQGVAAAVNPVTLAMLSFAAVICWLLIGTSLILLLMHFSQELEPQRRHPSSGQKNPSNS